jgi:hypothetical protein
MKPTTKILVIGLIITSILITGCVNAAQQNSEYYVKVIWNQHTVALNTATNSISKITIPEDNVTCYWVQGTLNSGGSLSCLRDEIK